MAPTTTDVFISYARDDRPAAQEIARLIEAQGFSVWWDRDLSPGNEFSDVIEHSLDAAKVVIVLWSATSRVSHWVRDEAAVGRDRNRLVPITIDGAEPPLGFRQIHTITSADVRNDAHTRAALLGALSNLCGRVAVAPAARPAPAPVEKPIKQILQEEQRQRTFVRTYWLMGLPIALLLSVAIALLAQVAETFPLRNLYGDAIGGFALASASLGLGRLFIVAGRRLSKRKSVRYFDGPTMISLCTSAIFAALMGVVATASSSGPGDAALVAVFIAIMVFPFVAFASIPIGFLKGVDRTTFENGK